MKIVLVYSIIEFEFDMIEISSIQVARNVVSGPVAPGTKGTVVVILRSLYDEIEIPRQIIEIPR